MPKYSYGTLAINKENVMKDFKVYIMADYLVCVGTITAHSAVDALRIAKQKGWKAPMIGDSNA